MIVRSTAEYSVIVETNTEKTALEAHVVHAERDGIDWNLHFAVLAHLRACKRRYFSEAQLADDIVTYLREYRA